MSSQLPSGSQGETEHPVRSLRAAALLGRRLCCQGCRGQAEAARLLSLHGLRFCSSLTTLG